jgi:NAD(P)-dependent dehydrogenase (short-subunit alcohol dehydrogenase family)
MENSILEKLFSLKDKKLVIAGGAGQIGYEVSKNLAHLGAQVIIADLDKDMAYQKLAQDGLENVQVIELDVSKKASIDQFASILGNDTIHGLVNCFHYKGNTRKLDTSSNFFAGFEDYPEEAWDAVHDVNLRGTFLLSQKLLPQLQKANGSTIINFSSTYGNVSANPMIYGDSGINSPVAYATSKSGILNLTRYMAIHLAKYSIRVNCLSPGGVFNDQDDGFVKKYSSLTPLGRMSRAEEYVAPIVYMLGPGASYMTGSNLIVDGGWTAW